MKKLKVLLHRIKNGFSQKGMDIPIFVSCIVLIGFGVLMIGSACIGAVNKYGASFPMKTMFFQAGYAFIGFILMMICTRAFKTRYISFYSSMLIYIFGIASMCVCRFWSIKGAHAWIKLGPVTIQPAEFMKVGMVLVLAYFFTRMDIQFKRGPMMTKQAKKEFAKKKFIRCFVFPVVLIFLAAGVCILIQKDLGTGIILLAICFTCFMVTPRVYYKKIKIVCWGFVGVAFVLCCVYLVSHLEGYQQARIETWLNPLKDPYVSSFQLVNSLIAFTNGELFGRGIGNSIQKFDYIPEAHNDFIGSIIYEELGVIGLALILIPTCIIIFRLLKYANVIQDDKAKVVLIGISSYFMMHLLVNLGGVSGLIPMTGVPILLVSQGGSATWSSLIGIGICQSIISKYNISKLDEQ